MNLHINVARNRNIARQQHMMQCTRWRLSSCAQEPYCLPMSSLFGFQSSALYAFVQLVRPCDTLCTTGLPVYIQPSRHAPCQPANVPCLLTSSPLWSSTLCSQPHAASVLGNNASYACNAIADSQAHSVANIPVYVYVHSLRCWSKKVIDVFGLECLVCKQTNAVWAPASTLWQVHKLPSMIGIQMALEPLVILDKVNFIAFTIYPISIQFVTRHSKQVNSVPACSVLLGWLAS